MPLTDTAIRHAKPREKSYKITDAQGLYLLIQTNGSKLWYLKYRLAGKESRLAFGAYPQTSLAEAREKRESTRKLISAGISPIQQRMTEKHATDGTRAFEHIALEWHASNKKWSLAHATKILRCLKRYVFPAIGRLNVSAIKTRDLADLLKHVESKGVLEVAARIQQYICNIMRYAVQMDYTDYNPALDLSGVISTPPKHHYPALPLERLPELLKRIENYQGRTLTRLAVEFCLTVFTRSSELRFARWSEFDLKNALWTIPAQREAINKVAYSSRGAKMKTPHLVPLSKQALAILKQLQTLSGDLDLVFPGDHNQNKPMSENTINKALRTMGYDTKLDVCGHGFRAMACSALVESGLWSKDAVERQMSHQERNGVRAAYIHKAEHMEARTLMMQWWADYLDKIKNEYIAPYGAIFK